MVYPGCALSFKPLASRLKGVLLGHRISPAGHGFHIVNPADVQVGSQPPCGVPTALILVGQLAKPRAASNHFARSGTHPPVVNISSLSEWDDADPLQNVIPHLCFPTGNIGFCSIALEAACKLKTAVPALFAHETFRGHIAQPFVCTVYRDRVK